MIENLEGEVWKVVDGYEGLYQVSSKGRIKSLNYNRTKEEGLLKPKKDKDRGGYLLVNLYKDGKMKTHKVHRLVACAFIDNPSNLPQVNHRNEIKTDNRVENLEFIDASGNINWGTRTKRATKTNKENGCFDKLKKINKDRLSKQVEQLDKNTNNLIKIWFSARQVQREKGFNQSSISKCCNGKLKSCGGFKWQFV